MYDNIPINCNADTPPDVWGFVEIVADIPVDTPCAGGSVENHRADWPTGSPDEPW